MTRRGSVAPVVVAALGVTGGVAIVASMALLQVAATAGVGTGEAIIVAIQVVSVGGLIGVYKEMRAIAAREETERQAVEARANVELKHIDDRVNTILADLATTSRNDGERYGRLLERSERQADDVERLGLRIDKVGSQISNQVAASLDARFGDFDRRFDEVNRALETKATK